MKKKISKCSICKELTTNKVKKCSSCLEITRINKYHYQSGQISFNKKDVRSYKKKIK